MNFYFRYESMKLQIIPCIRIDYDIGLIRMAEYIHVDIDN